MDERIKACLEASADVSKEELVRRLQDIFSDSYSEIDRWYPIGKDFWLRRKTANEYLCVQVFPIMDASYLCYLHGLDICTYKAKTVEHYRNNVQDIPDDLPEDIKHMYPIAISQDTDNAVEMFLASTADDKDEWLYKMGIK